MSVGAAVGGVKRERERCRAIESNSGNVLSFQFHFQRVVIGTAQGQRPCYADALKSERGRGRAERRKVKKHRDLQMNQESEMSLKTTTTNRVICKIKRSFKRPAAE